MRQCRLGQLVFHRTFANSTMLRHVGPGILTASFGLTKVGIPFLPAGRFREVGGKSGRTLGPVLAQFLGWCSVLGTDQDPLPSTSPDPRLLCRPRILDTHGDQQRVDCVMAQQLKLLQQAVRRRTWMDVPEVKKSGEDSELAGRSN